MAWQTHLSFGLLFTVIGFDLFGLPLTLGALLLAVAGSLAPDLDASESKAKHLTIKLGRRTSALAPPSGKCPAGLPRGRRQRDSIKPFQALSETLHLIFGHRGIMHSIVGFLILAGVITVLAASLGGRPAFYYAFLLGYLSHPLIDSFTPAGVELLWPAHTKIRFLPKSLAIRTFSFGDYLIGAACAFLLVIWISRDPTVFIQTFTQL